MFVGVIGRYIDLMVPYGNIVHYCGVFYDTRIFVRGAGDGYVCRVVKVPVHHYAITRGSFIDFIDEIGGYQIVTCAGGHPGLAVGAVQIAFAGGIGGLVFHKHEVHIVSALNFDGENVFGVFFDGYVAVQINLQCCILFVFAAVGHALRYNFAVFVHQSGDLGDVTILGKGDAVHDLTDITFEVLGRKLGTGVCNLRFL